MASTPITCPNCGRSNGPRALICFACGARLPIGRTVETEPAPVAAPNPTLLAAPDGAKIPHEQGLAEWCELHWDRAAGWLYTELPEKIEEHWGRTSLAQALRAITEAIPDDRNVGLDAALRLLDPTFPPPELKLDPPALDFGVLAAGSQATQRLRVANLGRGYLVLSLLGSSWLKPGETRITLAPGQQKEIPIYVDMGNQQPGEDLTATLRLRSQHGFELELPATAKAAGKATVFAHSLTASLPRPQMPRGSLRLIANVAAVALLAAALFVAFQLRKPEARPEASANATPATSTPRPTPRPTDAPTASPQPTQPRRATITGVAPQRLRVRASPGPEGEIVGLLDEGVTVDLLESDANGEWWHVRANDTQGWVSARFLKETGP